MSAIAKRLAIIVGILFQTLVAVAGAQQYRARVIGPSEYFHQRICTSLSVDEFGFLWIGCREGLFRYDGRSFKRVGRKHGKSVGLASQSIVALASYPGNRILVGTNRGLHVLNTTTHFFSTVQLDSDSGRDVRIRSLCVLEDSTILVGTDRGVVFVRFLARNKIIVRREKQRGAGADGVVRLMRYGKKRVLVERMNSEELVEVSYDASEGTFKNFQVDSGAKGVLYRSLVPEHTPDSLRDDRQAYRKVRVTASGRSFAVTTPGHMPEDIHIWPEEISQALLLDKDHADAIRLPDGTIWITSSAGLIQLRRIPVYSQRISAAHVLWRNTECRALLPHAGGVYVGTSSGTLLDIRPGGQIAVLAQLKSSINDILGIDRKKILITGTGLGLLELNVSTRKLNVLVRSKYSKGYHIVRSGDTLLASLNASDGSGSMLYRLVMDGVSKKIRVLDSVAVAMSVWTLHRLSTGQTLLGGDKGLMVISWPGACRELQSNWIQGAPLDVWAIASNESGEMWLGSWDSGLWKSSRGLSGFRPYYLPRVDASLITDLVFDAYNRLWLSTTSSIYGVPHNANHVFEVIARDEFPGQEVWAHGLHQLGDTVFAVGGFGFSSFQASHYPRFDQPANLIVEELAVNGRLVHNYIPEHQDLTFGPETRRVTFSVVCPNIGSGATSELQYRVEGIDTGWQSVPRDGQMSLSLLSSGTYTISLRQVGSLGSVLKRREVTVTVEPAFYATVWFSVLAGCIALGLVASFLHWKSVGQRRAVEQRRTVLELELQSLRLQMKPHFIFNALNAVQAFILTNDGERAIPLLGSLSRLIRLGLELSRHQLVPLARELDFIRLYVDIELERFEHSFTYVISMDQDIDVLHIQIPPILLQPYVENAIIHGLAPRHSGGRLTIHLRHHDDARMLCSIEDNGVGRTRDRHNEAQAHHSLGLTVNQERIQRLNEVHGDRFSVTVVDLVDSNGQPTGTRVDVLISTKG